MMIYHQIIVQFGGNKSFDISDFEWIDKIFLLQFLKMLCFDTINLRYELYINQWTTLSFIRNMIKPIN